MPGRRNVVKHPQILYLCTFLHKNFLLLFFQHLARIEEDQNVKN